jgi:hypothetical protein
MCRTSPVMLRDRPLVLEAASQNGWLSLSLIYNDGEPIEKGSGGGLEMTAYYILRRSKFGMIDLLQAQRDLTFRRRNVKHGEQYFARLSVSEKKIDLYER